MVTHGRSKQVVNKLRAYSRALGCVVFFGICLLIVFVITKGFNSVIVVSIESNLPILVIRMDSVTPVDVAVLEEFSPGTMHIISSNDGSNNIFEYPFENSKINSTYHVGIHIRGESTRNYLKKQFALKIYKDSNYSESKSVSLLGLPAQSKFALFSSSYDATIIRNIFSFDINRLMGHYAPRMRYIEVFICPTNTSNVRYPHHYYGTFVLEELIKRGKDFVDIAKLTTKTKPKQAKVENAPSQLAKLATRDEEQDISGGYIFRSDKRDDGDVLFKGLLYEYSLVYPEDDEYSPAMLDYIGSYMNSFESAIFSPNHTYNGLHYSELLNVSSFVDSILIQEFAKNMDAYKYSTYFYKDKNSVVVSGPIWDMDRTFGKQFVTRNFRSTKKFFITYPPGPDRDLLSIPKWWCTLVKDPWFAEKLVARWTELRADGQVLSLANVTQLLSGYKQTLTSGGAMDREINRWGPWYYPLMFWTTESYFESEYNILENWIRERLVWIDNNIGSINELAIKYG